MNIQRIAAFSMNGVGGNPAGVLLCDSMPRKRRMFEIARFVGYSETAFLAPMDDGWRVRYFSPQMEVPFCGHATIASGAALGQKHGLGNYKLYLNDGDINVDVQKNDSGDFLAALSSPATSSKLATTDYVNAILECFNFGAEDLNPEFPVRIANAGANHLVLVLNSRQLLADMSYQFDSLVELMHQQHLVTIDLVWPETKNLFHCRNPFPPGGVYEDPATGAAAAAFAGYLRDINYAATQPFEIRQGEDMGSPSRLWVEATDTPGQSIVVRGETHWIEAPA